MTAPCGCTNLCPLHAAAEAMREALRQIAKGEGAFSRDPLEHAINVIEEAKATARAALASAGQT